MNIPDDFIHMQVHDLIDVLNTDSHTIVDIRDFGSYSKMHIPKAIHLTNQNLADFIKSSDLRKPLVVCCYHGNDSQHAARYLKSINFTEVYSLDGGFERWQQYYPSEVEE